MIKNALIKIVEKIIKRNSVVISDKIEKVNRINFFTDRNIESKESIIDVNNTGLTISLTTFGKRIQDVFLAVESIGFQSLKAGRVVLWLAEDEFLDSKLPLSLKRLAERGLTINYCEDIKQYKKLIPSIKSYPNDIIITIDDDMLYNVNLIEILFNNHMSFPKVIFCGAANHMLFNENNLLKSYNYWIKNDKKTFSPSLMNFAIGFGGVLYFPNCFNKDITESSLFMHLAPFSDDIWFKTMSLLNEIEVCSVFNQLGAAGKQIPIEEAQLDSLAMINVLENKNDDQLKKVFDYYKMYKCDF